MLETGKLIKHENGNDSSFLSNKGRRELTRFIQRHTGFQWDFAPPSYTPFSFRIAHSDLDKNSGYQGKLTTRIDKLLHKHDHKLTPEERSQVGNIINEFSVSNSKHYLKFCDQIKSMKPGRFGDDGSCFYGSNAGAMDLMADHNFLVAKIYNSNKDPQARAWIYEIDDDNLVAFNGYGLPNGTREHTKIISDVLERDYHKIHFDNPGHNDVLYMNNTAYLVGDNLDIETYSLNIDDKSYCPYNYYCEACDDGLREGYVYIGLDDCPYCEECYNERFSNCTNCGTSTRQEDMIEVRDRLFCGHDCIERFGYVKCEQCHGWAYKPSGRYTYSGKEIDVCDSCSFDYYTREFLEEKDIEICE